MKRINILLLTFIFIALSALTSCGDSEPSGGGKEDPSKVSRTILVYAANRSSLSMNFRDDSAEMLRAMKNVDANRYKLLLFSTETDGETSVLSKAVKGSDGNYTFVPVKSYQRDVTALSPERMEQVVNDALAIYPNSAYDMIFWGHGMSWKPYFTDHNVERAFGGEYNPSGSKLDWMEINELAGALPDNRFETIWFDCCYMAGIETVFELQGKCRNFVAYPTEVWEDGMAYDKVLPHLFAETPDLQEAAHAFYYEYARRDLAATVTIVDMSKIDALAKAAHDVIASGNERPEPGQLVNYSRTKSSPFYDMRQFFSYTALANGAEEAEAALRAAFDNAVTLKLCSAFDFNNKEWNGEPTGLSTHYYRGTATVDESYYRTLKWYHRVYE